MEKVSYRLLRKLYKSDFLDANTVNELTNHHSGNAYNPCLSYLREEKMISHFTKDGKKDGEGGKTGETTYYKITIRGRDYVERKRKDAFSFWLPYAITTMIAAASLVLTIISLLE